MEVQSKCHEKLELQSKHTKLRSYRCGVSRTISELLYDLSIAHRGTLDRSYRPLFIIHSFNGLCLSVTTMRWFQSLLWLSVASTVVAQSTEGISNLVQRRLPKHADHFRFTLANTTQANNTHDEYVVSTAANGTVLVQGSSLSALSSGYV